MRLTAPGQRLHCGARGAEEEIAVIPAVKRMSILESKGCGGGEQTIDAAREDDAQLSTPHPSPLACAETSANSSETAQVAAGDVSTLPTLRPPAITAEACQAPISPAAAACSASSKLTASHAPESRAPGGSGFTSVVRRLSLRGWLRWIHSNHSDATLRVRTSEGSGRIWCHGGKIVDAEWGVLGAEEAVREMLSLASGAVTIDFDRVDRPRRIATAMHELLHVPERNDEPATETAQPEAALPGSMPGRIRNESFRSSLFLPLGGVPPAGQASSLRALPDVRRVSRGEYLAAVCLLATFAAAAFALGWMQTDSGGAPVAEAGPVQTQQTKSALLPPTAAEQPAEAQAIARELPVIPFVAIEVDPPRAEVWLDHELVGLGRVQLAPIADGALHELRFVAPGHQPKSLFFRNTPPAGRVILERSSEPAAAPELPEAPARDTAENERAAKDDGETNAADEGREAEREVANRPPRRRARPPRARAAPRSQQEPEAKSTPGKTSPQVQLIEVRTPRVQVLD